ncbi:MAG: carboxylesterase, partial [Ruminococcaceae bacterium]|nr:carboxylesterase [Oscillospiraceae bacterium]
YSFETDIPGWDNPGCFHSVDLWFFFESLAKCWRPFIGHHYDLARQMCDYWANFIKTGDPNGMGSDEKELPRWDTFSIANPVCMTFGDTARAEVRPASSLYEVLLDARYGESE